MFKVQAFRGKAAGQLFCLQRFSPHQMLSHVNLSMQKSVSDTLKNTPKILPKRDDVSHVPSQASSASAKPIALSQPNIQQANEARLDSGTKRIADFQLSAREKAIQVRRHRTPEKSFCRHNLSVAVLMQVKHVYEFVCYWFLVLQLLPPLVSNFSLQALQQKQKPPVGSDAQPPSSSSLPPITSTGRKLPSAAFQRRPPPPPGAEGFGGGPSDDWMAGPTVTGGGGGGGGMEAKPATKELPAFLKAFTQGSTAGAPQVRHRRMIVSWTSKCD